MLRRTIIALAAITIFMSVTALAGPKTGCNKFNVVGTFIAPSTADVFAFQTPPDHTVIHKLVFQLTLHADGTVNQYWTGLPDFQPAAGTGSPQIGSWACRSDGKLVIILIQASYFGATSADDPHVVTADTILFSHSRTTYLLSVDDDNTITRL